MRPARKEPIHVRTTSYDGLIVPHNRSLLAYPTMPFHTRSVGSHIPSWKLMWQAGHKCRISHTRAQVPNKQTCLWSNGAPRGAWQLSHRYVNEFRSMVKVHFASRMEPRSSPQGIKLPYKGIITSRMAPLDSSDHMPLN